MQKQVMEDLPAVENLGPIEAYIEALGEASDLPTRAVVMCVARFEEAAPALRALLAKAADGETLSEEEERRLLLALHILGGARDTQAWPLLLRLLARSGEDVEDFLGDLVTDGLARIAASLFDGDAEGLFAAIANPATGQFTRGALMDAAAFLTWKGVIDREAMAGFLTEMFEARLIGDFDFGWYSWQTAVALLGMDALRPQAKLLWDQGRIDDTLLDFRDFEEDLALAIASPKDDTLIARARLGYIEDVLTEVEGLIYPADDEAEVDDLDENLDDAPDAWDDGWDKPAVVETVVNPYRHVGRNDPCPCGSGKKFKKCCLAA